MDNGQHPHTRLEDFGFLALVLLVSLAFFWLIIPFFGAILWGVVAAILFAPVNRRLAVKFNGRRNLAASLTLLLILLIVIVPAMILGVSLVEQATGLYASFSAGDASLAGVFARLQGVMPSWLADLLARMGLGDFDAVQSALGRALTTGLQSIAERALVFGQGALNLLAALGVMLYLTFFLLRDGYQMGKRIKAALPLRPELSDRLSEHFIVVVRATMKGSVVVAIIQGIVGGVIFGLLDIEGALLWGLLMGFFSLVPAVGTGIIWVPVAAYLLATGSVWEGLVLTACGVLVIGMIDNVLRPFLVGKDTRMPDFVVLISTLAGIQLMGLSGFIVGPMIAALFIAVWNLVTEFRAAREVEP